MMMLDSGYFWGHPVDTCSVCSWP